jgi:membrane-bound serine protease (ClpP class)
MLFGITALFLHAAEVPSSQVYLVRIQAPITPVIAEFISQSFAKARNTSAEAIIIQLDTPGGLDTSMRAIVKDIHASSIPVVVYVAPSGARAASAGAIITLAAHVAAMAPGTNIGAAHPVSVGQKMDDVMAAKATNDAAAYIRSIAEQRGRNAQWAEDAVRKSISSTETQALKAGVIDIIADDVTHLLQQLDGRTVRTGDHQQRVLKTAHAVLKVEEMGFRHKLLSFISDPTVAYMLMLIGFYGIFFELSNPGSIAPGVIGAIALVLAFYAFQTLPVNYAGLLLILIGIVLFILEVKIVSYGLLTIGGIACLVFGSLMLFDTDTAIFKLSFSVILPSVAITAVFFFFTFRIAYRSQRAKVLTGAEGLLGSVGIVKTEVGPSGGQVLLHGELWSAVSDEILPVGTKIIVEAVHGLTVKVKKIE